MKSLLFFMTVLTLVMVGLESGAERSPAQSYVCKMNNGFVKAIGRGATKKDALAAAREACGTAMIEQYYAKRGKIDDAAELELTCINLECQ